MGGSSIAGVVCLVLDFLFFSFSVRFWRCFFVGWVEVKIFVVKEG